MTDIDPTLTYDPELDPGYFVQVSSQFVRHTEVAIETKQLYMVLLAYVVAKATAFPPQEVLAAEVGVSQKTLRVAAKALIDMNLLTVRRPGQGRPLVYHVHKLDLRPASATQSQQSQQPQAQSQPSQSQNGKNDRSRTVVFTVLERSFLPDKNGKNDRSLLRDTEKITEKIHKNSPPPTSGAETDHFQQASFENAESVPEAKAAEAEAACPEQAPPTLNGSSIFIDCYREKFDGDDPLLTGRQHRELAAVFAGYKKDVGLMRRVVQNFMADESQWAAGHDAAKFLISPDRWRHGSQRPRAAPLSAVDTKSGFKAQLATLRGDTAQAER